MKIFIDIETGGTDPNYHSLLSIALVKVDADYNIIDKKEWLVKPDKTYIVTPSAMSINKIDLVKHSKKGKYPYEVCDEIIEFIGKAYDDDKIQLYGHNTNFDKNFLEVMFDEESTYDFNKFFSYRVVDTSSIASFLIDLGILPKNCNSLDELIKYFSLSNDRHNALSDAIVTVEVYKQLTNFIKNVYESH